MINFFDINHWLDSDHYWLSSSLYNKRDKKAAINIFKQKLKDHDIKSLILMSKLAYGYDWDTGNNKLLKTGLSENIDGLYYCYAINGDTYFTYDFGKYLKEAFLNNVRLFRLFPKRHMFYINDYYMKKIYGILSEKRFPVMLDLKELDITGNKNFDIDALENILDRNKKMPLILETSLKQCLFNRYYFPLLERFENLYLEVSGLLLYDQIEHYVEKFGSKRLIFGTNHPQLPIEINTARMILADISETDKQDIVFNNLTEIIGGIEFG